LTDAHVSRASSCWCPARRFTVPAAPEGGHGRPAASAGTDPLTAEAAPGTSAFPRWPREGWCPDAPLWSPTGTLARPVRGSFYRVCCTCERFQAHKPVPFHCDGCFAVWRQEDDGSTPHRSRRTLRVLLWQPEQHKSSGAGSNELLGLALRPGFLPARSGDKGGCPGTMMAKTTQ
jgi:hypothetical protein